MPHERCRTARRPGPPGHRVAGFTLIELMIAIAVVALLGALAYPSFLDAVRKSRRADGMGALAAVQQAQERWRNNNANYSTSLADLNVPSSSSNGYYTISVTAEPGGRPLAVAYVATAVGKAGTSQENDKACRKLSVKLDQGSLSYAGCGNCAEFSYAATHACWAR